MTVSSAVPDNSLISEVSGDNVCVMKSEPAAVNSDTSDETIFTMKRAETAPTVPTLNHSPARQGGTDTNPNQELTMNTHTPTPPKGAMTLLLIDEDRSRPLNPGEPIKFNTTLDGQPVVTRSAVPMYDSCRVLSAWGFTGKVSFVRPDGYLGMIMDIAEGAKLTVIEDAKRGTRAVKFTPSKGDEAGLGSDNLPADTQAAIDGLEAAIAKIDGMTDAERDYLDGVAS
ncbi:MAG: hypothetical protein ACOH2N_04625 [Devosia sp.]